MVVIDFRALFESGDEALNQPLRSGDMLTVPSRRTGITVLGAVVRPGIIAYEPGRSVQDYVRLAGGYSRRADREDVTVLKGELGTRVDPRDVRTLSAGDQIIVPFQNQRRTTLEILQTTQSVIASVSGFVLTILALESLLR